MLINQHLLSSGDRTHPFQWCNRHRKCVVFRIVLQSYDSVTPKRRPVIRVVFAALSAAAIFGATASAASIPEPGFASDVSAESDSAAATAPLETDLTQTDDTVSVPSTTEAPSEPLDLAAIALANADARAQLLQSDSINSALSLVGIDANRSLGTGATPAEQEVAAEEVAVEEAVVEEAVVEEAEPVSEVLSESITVEDAADAVAAADEAAAAIRAAAEAAAIDEATLLAASRVDLSLGERAAVLAREVGTPTTEAQAQAAWDAGYTLGGGRNLSSFHNTIIPCESGGQPNRDSVVGFTDDWGRAQINRPVWSSTFRDLTGVAFEEGVVLPTLNGYMAAHIEQVQGLSAWTCWRNR